MLLHLLLFMTLETHRAQNWLLISLTKRSTRFNFIYRQMLRSIAWIEIYRMSRVSVEYLVLGVWEYRRDPDLTHTEPLSYITQWLGTNSATHVTLMEYCRAKTRFVERWLFFLKGLQRITNYNCRNVRAMKDDVFYKQS